MKQVALICALVFSFYSFAQSIETKEFWICTQEGVEGLRVRSLRIHHFKEDKKCLGLYSVGGKDQVVAYGKWLSFCQKMLAGVKKNLEGHLWYCKSFDPVLFHYSEKRSFL